MGLGSIIGGIADVFTGGSGIGSAIGGYFDASSASNKKNDFAANAQGLNYAHQKEFAQNGIRWKVEDAKAAGIHPLFALGAQGATFSPISVGELSTPIS